MSFKKNAELSQEIDILTNEVNSLRPLRIVHDVLSRTKKELVHTRITISERDEEISNLSNTVKAMEAEISLLKKTIHEKFSGFSSLLEAIRLYDEKRDEELALHLETKSHPAFTSAQLLRFKSRRLRKTEEECRKLHFENERLINEVQVLTARPDIAQKELEELRTEAAKAQENLTEKCKENEELRNCIQTLQAEIDKLKFTQSELESLESQITALQEDLTVKSSENEELRKYIQPMQSDSNKYTSLQAETEILRTQTDLLHKDLTEKYKENEELRNCIQTLQADKDKLNFTQAELELLKSKITILQEALTEKSRENDNLCRQLQAVKSDAEKFRKMLSEAPLGFPSLLEALKLYDAMKDKRTSANLEKKSNPALKAAEIVRIETRKRREAEYECRRTKCLLEYYFKTLIQEDRELLSEHLDNSAEYSPESCDEDMTAHYLSNDEYFGLSVTERNQLALDRFWKRNKSKQTIGRLYEQYVGWLHEKEDWIVEYFGISEGFSDLGRDLLCHKDITTLIVQCKNWSKSKRIYEKHIFQLFGTMYEYRKNHPFETVKGVFYTSTSLSDLARSFAGEFHIELHENFELKRFPVIKCNIGREGERIYHLPFDQQYYNTRINAKDGDCYCMSIEEAESKGFRRAYRWHGNK